MGIKPTKEAILTEGVIHSSPWLTLHRRYIFDELFYIIEYTPTLECISEDEDLDIALLKWEYLMQNLNDGQLLSDPLKGRVISNLDQIESQSYNMAHDMWIFETKCALEGRDGTFSVSFRQVQFVDDKEIWSAPFEMINSITLSDYIRIDTDDGDMVRLSHFGGTYSKKLIYHMLITLWEQSIAEALLMNEATPDQYRAKLLPPVHSEQGIRKLYINETVKRHFKQLNPNCIYSMDCSIRHTLLNVYSNGTIHFTETMIYFISFGNGKHVQSVIPFYDVEEIRMKSQNRLCMEIISKYTRIQILAPKRRLIMAFMKANRLRTQVHTQESLITYVNQLELPSCFFLLGKGRIFMMNQKFREYVHRGMHDSARSLAWQISSNAFYNKVANEEKQYYKLILEKVEEKKHMDQENIESIDEDLRRSFSDLTEGPDESLIGSLRNILMAFSFHCPEIGYCQSMNIIGGFLLTYMEEASAFYMLVAICQNMLFNFYSKTISGTIINQNIFTRLLQLKKPNIASYLREKDVPIEVVVTPWFMCLFISYLPKQIVVRILDRFFMDGIIVLHQAALTIFSLSEEQIYKEKHSFNILTTLRSDAWEVDQFFKEMDTFKGITMDIYLHYQRKCSHNYLKSRNRQAKEEAMKATKG